VPSCCAVRRHGLKLACLGVVAGLAAALVLTRLMETLLFAVRPNDPATLTGVAALIAAVAAASLIPAFRATRVDRLVAFKESSAWTMLPAQLMLRHDDVEVVQERAFRQDARGGVTA
jgi:hypothetical protein